ncbi:hypothetical protein [Fodinibius salsisoli]|uniref:Outer membrane protein beta-barrel domain-containing protein n=1 Tax=Fodinibius salsisoli TaxID=2820877 RepID=A0ABT3PPB1_9BACT|nr:hypothetical protein [Fodinibius salsisoli]MCW9707699.1 hypothetical protein [Fodinibius salsisoli]
MKKNATVLFLLLFLGFSSISHAQTTYKSDPGFYTPVVKSLYLRGGVFEDAQLIGPAVGYRFNERYDVTVHTEFLSNEYKFNNSPNPKTTLLNLGVILGRTTDLSDQFLLRSELSVYQAITFNTEAYNDISEPSLTSGIISSSLYRNFPLSGSISLLPNIGAFLGYGNYTTPYSSAHLRQGFDGFVVGPKFGFDLSFKLSDSFYLVANPEVSVPLNKDSNEYGSTLLFNVQLNF